MHNRLHSRPRPFPEALLAVTLACCIGALPGCDDATGPLAEYRGARALDFLQVTQHYRPDIQWVGGRVAVVGVNRGPEAALDETLVWLLTAEGDDISSFVRLGAAESDPDAVAAFGGTPVDSLEDGVDYTFWLAERSVFEAGLVDDSGLGFADSTVTIRYVLLGRSGGDRALDVSFRVIREQTLVDEQYYIDWTPASVGFRRLAIREGTTGGWDRLKWHLIVPEGSGLEIRSPLHVGEAPDGISQAAEWPEEGFGKEIQNTVWAATGDWTDGDFGFRSTGYAFFQVFATNFPKDE